MKVMLEGGKEETVKSGEKYPVGTVGVITVAGPGKPVVGDVFVRGPNNVVIFPRHGIWEYAHRYVCRPLRPGERVVIENEDVAEVESDD